MTKAEYQLPKKKAIKAKGQDYDFWEASYLKVLGPVNQDLRKKQWLSFVGMVIKSGGWGKGQC